MDERIDKIVIHTKDGAQHLVTGFIYDQDTERDQWCVDADTPDTIFTVLEGTLGEDE